MFSKLLNLRKDPFLLFLVLLMVIHTFSLFLIYAPPTYSLTMSNQDYLIQLNNLDNSSNLYQTRINDNPIIVLPTKKNTNLPSLEIVKGFQYIPLTSNFKFNLSSQFIDYGHLSATNPVIRTQFLSITEGSAFGYVVTVSEDHLLQIPSTNTVIPDTTCDLGTCSEINSGSWTSSLTYGLGYRCDNIIGNDCAFGFTDQSYYKQFSNLSTLKIPQVIMQGLNQGISKKSEVTYKLNISATQPAGQYSNLIEYIAIPNF